MHTVDYANSSQITLIDARLNEAKSRQNSQVKELVPVGGVISTVKIFMTSSGCSLARKRERVPTARGGARFWGCSGDRRSLLFSSGFPNVPNMKLQSLLWERFRCVSGLACFTVLGTPPIQCVPVSQFSSSFFGSHENFHIAAQMSRFFLSVYVNQEWPEYSWRAYTDQIGPL